MRALRMFALLSLAGCWPRIPGAWEDYDTPEETQIIGQFAWYEFQGAYWSDDTDFGSAWFAWLEQPDAEVTTQKLFHASVSGCQKGAVDIDWLTDRFASVGAGQAQIQHPGGRVSVPWNGNIDFFYTNELEEDDVEEDAQYDLVALPIDGVPTYVESFVSLPPDLAFDGPEIDGELPEEVEPEDLVWTWSPADAVGQWVVIETILVDADGTELERVGCIAEGATGRIEVTDTYWDKLDDAAGWNVFQQNFREAHSRIETEAEGIGSSRMAGLRGKIGYLELN